MYGYKSCKWLERIDLLDALPGDGGYWESRGYELDGFTS
jgi:DMSO/TMAO reductase YedYZ molybdopterin-dependent catalytic subunit